MSMRKWLSGFTANLQTPGFREKPPLSSAVWLRLSNADSGHGRPFNRLEALRKV